ncbi:MAG TPA: hypothetical protein PLX35_01960 [Cyclobacteriaceae bacterium]|nr:hypothetical protein [Cyclobacteriaceae bacterium]
MSRIRRSNFFIKLTSWEYWPFGILQAPVFPYWLWLALKARTPVFFSASNPGILMGGMFGESKYEVLEKVPANYKPVTLLMKYPASREQVLASMRESGLQYPVVCKPDLGERGWMVRRIYTDSDLDQYLQEIKLNFIVQDCVDLPLEFGVFYVRYPEESTGRVTSIVGKEMLHVVGDGLKSLEQLILEKDRAKLQWPTLREKFEDRLSSIISRGERVELVSIGNHCLGTMFLNNNHLISPAMSASFDRISKQIDGFYFGRFDLRVKSIEDLEAGNIQILELNGCGAEPAHIYQPGYSFFAAVGVLIRHWHDIYRISVENHRRGVSYITWREARRIYGDFRALTR